jgi:large-conductance mechanosensitive channel
MAATGRNPGKPTKRKSASTHTHVITTSAGNVRITEPKNLGTKRGKPGITVLVGEQAQQLNPVSGFVGFLRERAVVGVAIAFVVATQMQAVVKVLIDKFIDPAFKLLFGGVKLSDRIFTLHWHGRAGTFGWGAVVYALVDFLFVVGAIYLIIRLFKLDKLDKKKD